MKKKHLPNILNYFKHQISHAVAEGLNSKIQTVKANARGSCEEPSNSYHMKQQCFHYLHSAAMRGSFPHTLQDWSICSKKL
jgi:hypothetical protein